MKQQKPSQKSMRATLIYTWILRLYPGAYRRTYAQPMLQTFQDHYRDAIETEKENKLLFWLGVASDSGKSVLIEHTATLQERTHSMKNVFPLISIAGFLLLLGLLFFPVTNTISDFLLVGMNVLALLTIMASVLQTFHCAKTGRNWLRLGSALGGIFSLYLVIFQLLGVFIPSLHSSRDISLLQPFLFGTAGLIGGYTSGKWRLGTFTGLLAGFILLVVTTVSQMLLVVPLHLLFLSQRQHSVDVQQLFRESLFQISPVFLGRGILITLVVAGLFATFGGALSAFALRRAEGVSIREVQSDVRLGFAGLLRSRTGFALTMLILCLLTWWIYSRMEPPFSFISPTFVAWLCGFLVVLVSVLFTTRPNLARQEAKIALR